MSGLAQASCVLALLPIVVIDDAPATLTWSHAKGEARLRNGPVGIEQSAVSTQQPMTSLPGVLPIFVEDIDGLAGK